MQTFPTNPNELKKILPPGKSFCLIGGCFDLIHVGHLHLLKYAATLNDFLVVAVLSDRYVQTYKHANRPIINERQRASMVASIRCVDYVYIADESPSNHEVLSLLVPDSIVFGAETGNELRIQQRIEQVRRSSPKTNIRLLPRYEDETISTGYIIKKIREMTG